MRFEVGQLFLPVVLVGIVAGIVVVEVLNLGFFFMCFVLAITLGVVLLSYALRVERELGSMLFLVVLFALCVVVGVLRSEQKAQEFVLPQHAESDVIIFGQVIAEPEERESYQALTVNATLVNTKQRCTEINEKVLVRADRFLEVSYGDEVLVSGELSIPDPFETDAGREFAYDDYLKKDGIGSIISFASVEVTSRGGGGYMRRLLLDIKESYLNAIARLIPDPEASLLGGLTVGVKQSLGDELEDDFRSTGIIHIVVLSGYNIVIVAEAIFALLRYFSIRTRVILGVVGIVLFATLVGGGATVVRASIMAVAALIGRALGREALAIQTLLFAAVVMIINDPALLMSDPSFQLSFVATLGLITLSEHLERFLAWIHYRWLREIVTATMSTQIAVLPLLIYQVGEISLVSLPVNLLVLPSVPVAMLFGFLAGVSAMLPIISVFLAPVFAAVAFLVLSYELLVVEVFAQIPFASVLIPPLPFSLVIAIYVFFGFLVWHSRNLSTMKRKSSVILESARENVA